MTTTFESLSAGDTIDGPTFAVSRKSIRLFCGLFAVVLEFEQLVT
jgi:hypothetical protein